MPFGLLTSSTSPFDEILERATAEVLTSENWELILTINDKVTSGGAKAAKDCLLSIKKRLNHRDPHVVVLALSVLDSCLCNCGKKFQHEACSKEFMSELKSKATGSNTVIADKTRQLIKKWLDEYKDLSSTLLNTLYIELKRDGFEFPTSNTTKSTVSQIAALENALREEEELNKAIQLSLNEQGSKGAAGSLPSSSSFTLYPSAGPASAKATDSTVHTAHQQIRSVKALYDFEAAEDNELTFKAGETITVVEDSDANWWKGVTSKGEGLFPASFVTADLNVDVDQLNAMEKKKNVQFADTIKVETIAKFQDERVTIDEQKITKCLEMLQNADPTGEREDPSELLNLEEQCLNMAPLIDGEMTKYDLQINQLSDINLKLMDALNLYHSAMSTVFNPYQFAPNVSQASVSANASANGQYVPQAPYMGQQFGSPQQQPNHILYPPQ